MFVATVTLAFSDLRYAITRKVFQEEFQLQTDAKILAVEHSKTA